MLFPKYLYSHMLVEEILNPKENMYTLIRSYAKEKNLFKILKRNLGILKFFLATTLNL